MTANRCKSYFIAVVTIRSVSKQEAYRNIKNKNQTHKKPNH